MVEQPAGNGLIGLGNQSHCRTALLELIEDTSNDPLVFLMVPLMVLIIRIAILTLELFLITEVIGNVVVEEFQSLADLATALAFSTGQQQIVDCVNQLFVLAVDQVVSGFKLRCELIGLDLGSLAGRLSLLHRLRVRSFRHHRLCAIFVINTCRRSHRPAERSCRETRRADC